MHLILTEDYEELSRAGANLVAEVISANPTANVLVATGETPMGIYRELTAYRQRGKLDALGLRVFQLDEYLDLEPGDHRSLYDWTVRAFVEPMGVPESNVVRLEGAAEDPESACHAYEEAVRGADGIDLAVLGLGPNGHLGFNEPPAYPDAPTRVVDLTEESVKSNGYYWGGPSQVPRRALTAGMTVLLAARQTLLVVSGERKREVLRRALKAPITPDVPASYLQLAPNVTVIADRAAWGHDVADIAENDRIGAG